MNLKLYKQALDLEDTAPKEALEIYHKLDRENSEFYADILLAAIIFPFLASIIAFLTVQSISSHQIIAIVLILSGVGFAPPLFMYGKRLVEKVKGLHLQSVSIEAATEGPIITIFTGFFYFMLILIVAVLMVAIIWTSVSLVHNFLTGAPFVSPGKLPMHVHFPIFLGCFAFFLLFLLSRVDFRPFSIKRILKEIPIGLKANSSEIPQFIAKITIGFNLVGNSSFGILHEDFRYAIMLNCFTGLLLGLAFARALKKDKVLDTLYEIARARCLIRLDRQIEAGYRLKKLVKKIGCPAAAKYLAYALLELIEDSPRVEECLNEAATRSLRNSDKYRELYLDSLLKEKQLAGLGNDLNLLKR